MANKTVDSMTNGAPLVATDEFYITRSPYGVGDDRKIAASALAAFVVLTGAADPNGVVTGAIGQIYTQVSGGAVTIWVNTTGGTVWV